MLRRVLSFSFVLLLVLGVASVAGQGIVLGAKGGVNFANVDSDDPEFAETDSRAGFLAGAFLTIGIGDVFAVQPEAFYSEKGLGTTEEGVDLDLKLAYFEIPLLLKAVLGGAQSQVHFAPYVGGAVSFEASCEGEGSSDGVTLTIDCDDPAEPLEREKTDFGLVFGAEVLLDIGDRLVVLVDGRYNLGLRNLDATEDPSDTKNRVFSIMAGVGVRLN